jgi:uncharacterized membrane protein (DUF485 family)
MKDAAKTETTHVVGTPDWSGIARSEGFRHLIAVKKNFILPAFVFFLVYFFSLAILVGYAPKIASIRVTGTVNIAYLFVLSQFVAGWVIAALYLIVANRFDALSEDVLAQLDQRQGDE